MTEEVLIEIEHLVVDTKKILSKCTIVVCEYFKDRKLALKYESSIVKKFCDKKYIEYVTYDNDGVHASKMGVWIIVSNMKTVLNTLLCIKTNEVTNGDGEV